MYISIKDLHVERDGLWMPTRKEQYSSGFKVFPATREVTWSPRAVLDWIPVTSEHLEVMAGRSPGKD